VSQAGWKVQQMHQSLLHKYRAHASEREFRTYNLQVLAGLVTCHNPGLGMEHTLYFRAVQT
jgi:hypothetical protein